MSPHRGLSRSDHGTDGRLEPQPQPPGVVQPTVSRIPLVELLEEWVLT